MNATKIFNQLRLTSVNQTFTVTKKLISDARCITARIALRWLVPVSSRGDTSLLCVTRERHAIKRHETHEKKTRNQNKYTVWRHAAFFVLGYYCPVLNEIRVYPRLYLLARPQLIPHIQEKLFPEFNAQVAKAKLRSWGGFSWERKGSQNGYKIENQHTTTSYLFITYFHKLYKPSQTLHNIW